MDLIDVKISEIKNLGLIYLYNTDSIFTREENRYLGLKISYNNAKDYIQMDYIDPHFPDLIKKIISRYNQEKDNRNIILLGNLTKRLFEDDEIRKISEERQSYNSEGLSLFSTNLEKLKSFEPYLKEVLRIILERLKRYKVVTIDKIDGYNKKYVVNYSIGSVKKSFPIIISFIDNKTISFKIGTVDEMLIGVTGTIKNDLSEIICEWKSDICNASGHVLYDVVNNIVDKKVTLLDEDVYHNDVGDTIIDSDIELIQFYLNLFSIEWDKEFMKTSDYNFIFGYDNSKIVKEEDALVENHGMQLYVTDNEVVLKYVARDSLKKYNNALRVDLEEELCEITVKKVYFDGDTHLLVEKTSGNAYGKKYDYVIYKTGDIDFKQPFEIQKEARIDTEVQSIYDVTTKALELMGGNN